MRQHRNGLRHTCGIRQSPRSAKTITRLNFSMDIREVLPSVRAPTLVLCRQGDRWAKIEEARYLAAHVPEAKLVELPGEDHLPWWGGQDEVVAEIQEFVTGTRENRSADRVLVTILMTDIVASTAKASSLGDRSWKELLQRHDTAVRRQLSNFVGQEVNTTGEWICSCLHRPDQGYPVRESNSP